MSWYSKEKGRGESVLSGVPNYEPKEAEESIAKRNTCKGYTVSVPVACTS